MYVINTYCYFRRTVYECPHQTNNSCTWPGDGREDAPKSSNTYYLYFVNKTKDKVTNLVRMKPVDECKF
jgi:hypothetical protein